MRKTTMFYRPATVEETAGLIEETVNVIVDMRAREGVLENLGLVGGDTDTNGLKGALRTLLPHYGFGDAEFRHLYGWTEEEINRIISLLQMVERTLKASEPALSGTATTLFRDSEKIDRITWRWFMLTD